MAACKATMDFDSGWGIDTMLLCNRTDDHWLHRHVDIDGRVVYWTPEDPAALDQRVIGTAIEPSIRDPFTGKATVRFRLD